MSEKVYTLAGKKYLPKEKYSLKTWGEIIKILNETETDDPIAVVGALLSGDKLVKILNLILDKNIEGELMEDDLPEVSRVITDFFSRKSSLLKNGNVSPS
jgi:putative heme iron utilization protein